MPDRAAARRAAAEELRPGDVVLVKATRVVRARAARRRPADGRGPPRESASSSPPVVGADRSRSCSPRWRSGLPPAGLRPGDPRRRPAEPPGQAGHAHDGRRGDHRRHRRRLPRRAPGHARPAGPGSPPPALLLLFLMVGTGRRRLPRRLHQAPPPAQPRPEQDGQDGRPAARRRRPSRSSRCSSPTPTASRRPRQPSPSCATSPRSRSGWSASWCWPTCSSPASSNAVNLTDGLDGLAAGTAAMVLGVLRVHLLLAVPQRLRATSSSTAATPVRDPLDVALVAAAALGACLGFLWWNAARPGSSWATPARWRSAG